jgi:AraC family transcriptional regulator
VFHACTNGHATRRVEVGGMLVIDAMFPAGTWLPPHEHPRRSLVVVLSGGFLERIEGRDIEVSSGTVYLRPAALHHAHLYGAEPTRCLTIEWIERPEITLGLAYPAGRPLLLLAGSCGRIGARIARMPWDPQPTHRLRLESLVLELLACVASRGGAQAEEPPEWLRSVHEQLRAAFRDPPSVVELAASAGVHQSHLLRRFRRHYGMSPTGLVRRWKAEYARTLLAEPGASLSAVAFEAGFADQSHMGRVMRREYGTTPGKLQREEVSPDALAHASTQMPPHDRPPHD